MTFVLGADATAGALEETGHKGEGRRVAKSDRPGSPSLLRSWVTRAWGEVWRPHKGRAVFITPAPDMCTHVHAHTQQICEGGMIIIFISHTQKQKLGKKDAFPESQP